MFLLHGIEYTFSDQIFVASIIMWQKQNEGNARKNLLLQVCRRP